MGQKSRQKKNRQSSTNKNQPAVTPKTARPGLSLDKLAQATHPINNKLTANHSYEMIGDLPREIRRVLILVAAFAVLITVLSLVGRQNTALKSVGERTASFLNLR